MGRAAACVAAAVAALVLLLAPPGCAAGRGTQAAFDATVLWTTPTTEPGNNTKGQPTFQGGMPLGNGVTALLAWPNTSTGALSMFVMRSDAMDASTALNKLGLLSIRVLPNPFAQRDAGVAAAAAGAAHPPFFHQQLHADTASMEIRAGGSSYERHVVRFNVYVDANSDNAVVEVSQGPAATEPLFVEVELTSVRPEHWFDIPSDRSCEPLFSPPDVVLPGGSRRSLGGGTATIYHRNRMDVYGRGASIFNSTLQQQGLGHLLERTQHLDHWTNLQFGMAVSGLPELMPAADHAAHTASRTLLHSKGKGSSSSSSSGFNDSITVVITTLTQRTDTADEWLQALAAAHAHGRRRFAEEAEGAWAAHVASWSAFWDRAYVVVGQNNTDSHSSSSNSNSDFLPRQLGRQQRRRGAPALPPPLTPFPPPVTRAPPLPPLGPRISQMYVLTRYVQSIQTRGRWPIKFNGMLFVANMPPATNMSGPDYRDWGSCEWWQNLRLPYYNMLSTGDHAELESLFSFYLGLVELSQLRTHTYFKHSGIFFTETKTRFGIYNPSDYGCNRPPGPDALPVWLEQNGYIHLDFGGNAGGPEVALIALDHYRYTLDEAALKRRLPLVVETLEFFRQHYPMRTPSGERILYPTQVLETYWCTYPFNATNCATNDLPTVSGLHALLERALALPAGIVPQDLVPLWQEFQRTLPPVPINSTTGYLMPAAAYNPMLHNSETPELYAVHPYQIYSVGALATGKVASLKPALGVYARYGPYGSGWSQTIMVAALLGQASDAFAAVADRALTPPADGYRFDGFAPHEQDYEPSTDHFANMNSATNFMLLQDGQDADGTIVLLPAWPCEIDVAFRLPAPLNTTVEMVLERGTIVFLSTEPLSAIARVLVANCDSGTYASRTRRAT